MLMTLPLAGSRTISRSVTSAGLDRSTRPTMLITPAAVTMSVSSCAEARSTARGFSQNTGLPASAHRRTPSMCAAVQVHTNTTSDAATTASASAATEAPVARAKSAARSASVSKTTAIRLASSLMANCMA